MIGIYKITCLENDKFYIGSSKNIEIRFTQHLNDLRNNKHCNIIMQNSFNKYGEKSFIFEIIEECEKHNLLIIEQIYLDKYKSSNKLFNIGLKSCGGDNLTNHPNRDEIIEKIKYETNKAISNLSEKERREKWNNKGEKNPNYNKKWTIEMKNNLSKKMKGRYVGEKNPFYGKEHSEETKEILSNNAKERIGEKNPFYGKKHSEKTKEKIKNKRIGIKPSNSTKIIIDGIIYDSYLEASKILKIPSTTIRHRCLSKNIKYENYQLLN